MRAGWSRVERQQHTAVRLREKKELLGAKIDIGKFCIVARPSFPRCKENGAQGFAALDSRCWLLRFGGLRMKGVFALIQFGFGSDCRERTIILDCIPVTNY